MIGSRYLNGVSVVNWPLHRIFLSAFANKYIRAVTQLTPRDCTSGFRCWRREALARLPLGRHGLGRLRVPRRDALRGEAARLPHRRGADHLRRARAGTVESVDAGAARIADHPLAARASAAPRPEHGRGRRDGDDVVSPVPGRQRRHLHGADCRVRRRARATKSTSSPPGIRSSRATPEEHGVRFHFYKYAPLRSLNVFGYAAALRADVQLRGAAYLAAPLALAAGWLAALRVARRYRATVMHGHWVIPGGFTALAAAPARPQVVSLHGSDVYVAETLAPARRAARLVFERAGAVTACSADLAQRAIGLGADPATLEVVPYGVDTDRFRPQPEQRARAISARLRRARTARCWRSPPGGWCARRGSSISIDAWAIAAAGEHAVLAIAGDGDLRRRAARARPRRQASADRVRFLGNLSQDDGRRAPRGRRRRGRPVRAGRQRQRRRPAEHRARGAGAGAAVVATAAGGIGTVVEHETDRAGRAGTQRPRRSPRRSCGWAPIRPCARGSARRRGAMVEARFGWARVGRALRGGLPSRACHQELAGR